MREGWEGERRGGGEGRGGESEVTILVCFFRYYRTNDVQKFRYDRPFHRGQKDPQCEFAVS